MVVFGAPSVGARTTVPPAPATQSPADYRHEIEAALERHTRVLAPMPTRAGCQAQRATASPWPISSPSTSGSVLPGRTRWPVPAGGAASRADRCRHGDSARRRAHDRVTRAGQYDPARCAARRDLHEAARPCSSGMASLRLIGAGRVSPATMLPGRLCSCWTATHQSILPTRRRVTSHQCGDRKRHLKGRLPRPRPGELRSHLSSRFSTRRLSLLVDRRAVA